MEINGFPNNMAFTSKKTFEQHLHDLLTEINLFSVLYLFKIKKNKKGFNFSLCFFFLKK